MIRLVALVLFVGLCVVQAPLLQAAERVALVIGNGKYEHATELPNPRNDAEEMASVLSGLGFEVIKGIDLDHDAMEGKIREFAQAVRPAKLALFFYAGHGMQVNGRNFLIPIDAELADSTALDFEAVDADQVFRYMGSADRVALAFLDACRNNPLARRFARTLGPTRSASVGNGLAAPSTTGTGLFIAFATAPNDVALDGEGSNSPFTQALLKHLPSPGLEIQQLMTRVKADVSQATAGDQRPWHSSDLQSDVYLLPTQTADPEQDDSLAADFAIARDMNTKETWEAFLVRHGDSKDSFYVQLAEAALNKVAIGIFPPVDEPAPKPPHSCQGGVVAKVGTEQRCLRPGDTFRDCPECPKMVVVPAGRFTMGSPASEIGRSSDEGPQHEVTIARTFAVGKFEVTFAEWDVCMGAGGCDGYRPDDRGWGRGSRPVINVSWEDAKSYAAWLSKTTGAPYRLLSEAEWEYAARAGTTTPFSTGEIVKAEHNNFGLQGLPWRTAEVGTISANYFDLHDMHGNVWEWVEDCWNADYEDAPSDGSPSTGDCSHRVLRGGSWDNPERHLRSAARLRYTPGFRYKSLGIRLAKTIDPAN